MSLKTFVKIGKIDNLSDARYCAGMMVDILGFNLEEGTEGHVDPEKFKEITDWLAGVKFCGEFTNAHVNEVKLAASNYPIDYLEVQQADQLEELSNLEQELIYKINITNHKDIEQLESQIAFAEDLVALITITTTNTNNQLIGDIEKALSLIHPEVPLLRGFGLDQSTVSQVAESENFRGIELEGSPEERPGYKDYGQVMDILEAIEE